MLLHLLFMFNYCFSITVIIYETKVSLIVKYIENFEKIGIFSKNQECRSGFYKRKSHYGKIIFCSVLTRRNSTFVNSYPA